MTGNILNSHLSGPGSRQKGQAFPETVIVLISVVVVSLVVSFAVFGPSLFSADRGPEILTQNPDAYKSSPEAFSPITDLEKNGPEHPERAFSTVKGAISDLESSSAGNTSALSTSRDK